MLGYPLPSRRDCILKSLKKVLLASIFSKEFFTLVLSPVINEIERRISRLERTDNKIEEDFNEKNTTLNMTLMAVSVLGPASLIIFLTLTIYLERKLGNLRSKVREITAANANE